MGVYGLSDEAKSILREASRDKSGSVRYARVVGGTHIDTNYKSLIPSQEPREIAKWEAALEELEYEGFISDIDGRRKVFRVTKAGFEVADQIEE